MSQIASVLPKLLWPTAISGLLLDCATVHVTEQAIVAFICTVTVGDAMLVSSKSTTKRSSRKRYGKSCTVLGVQQSAQHYKGEVEGDDVVVVRQACCQPCDWDKAIMATAWKYSSVLHVKL